MTNAIGIICWMILFFMAELVVVYYLAGRKEDYMEKHPIETVPAILISKKEDRYSAQRTSRSMASERYRLGLDKPIDILADPDKIMYAARYYVTFATEDHEIKKFRINALEYENMKEGQKGSLTYQGKIYIGFYTDYT